MANHIQSTNKLIELKDILSIWKLIRKNLALLIILPAIAYSIGYIYVYRLSDIYGAKAQLLLKSNETYDYQDPIYKGLGAYGMYMDVSNQIRILQSRDLIEEVVDKMDVNISYYIIGRLKRKEVFGTLPFRAEVEIYNEIQMYETPIQIKIENENNYVLNYELGGVLHQENGVFGQDLITTDFRLVLEKNYSFSKGDLDKILAPDYEMIVHSKAYMIDHFKSRMAIENIEYTSILEVNVTDDIEARAKVFLDTLSAVFIDYSQRSQLAINKNTLDNIEKQIDEVQKILVNIEAELLKYKNENDIIHLTKEEDAYFKLFVTYTDKNVEFQNQLSSVNLLEDYIKNSSDDRLLPPSFYVLQNDVYLQTKVTEYYTLQLSISESILNVTEDHPTVVKMKNDLDIMRKDILVYLKNLQKAIGLQIIENNKLIAQYKSDVQGIPRSLQGVENIRRELEVNNKMYLFLLEKKTNTLIARAGIIPQVQIIETAASIGVTGPNKTRVRNLFTLMGVIIALVIAVVRRLFFEKIESVHELKEISTIPVLGGLPWLKGLTKDIVVVDQPKAQITESFRNLRTNISFLGNYTGAKKILISSFFPGEGKTFCSSNLATILAKSEKKVLLVDLDLHKPKVHKSFELDNQIGMTNFLIGSNKIEDVIADNLIENLDIIPSGPIPPNPSELILQETIKEFFEFANKNYDYLIIDTPPFGLLSDSIELGKHADVFIAVLNSNFARKRGVQTIEDFLSRHENLSTGLILNGIRQSKFSYYYSKYSYKYSYRYSYASGYGYGYGSGYGSDQNDD